MKDPRDISVHEFIKIFNKSEFRRKSIPMELSSGWPSICRVGKMFSITIPYFKSVRGDKAYDLYPLICSVTLPLGNPDRILDFTVYPYQPDWRDVDYSRPAGTFRHEALADVTKQEYDAMRERLYGYYDEMVQALCAGEPFAGQAGMTELFSRLMEPGHYPQYLRINEKFYSCLCRL